MKVARAYQDFGSKSSALQSLLGSADVSGSKRLYDIWPEERNAGLRTWHEVESYKAAHSVGTKSVLRLAAPDARNRPGELSTMM